MKDPMPPKSPCECGEEVCLCHLVLPRLPTLRELAENSRREAGRVRSVRRRLFGEADAEGGRGGSDGEGAVGREGGSGDVGRRHRSRRRRPSEHLSVMIVGPQDGTVGHLMAEDVRQARQRWNFDFENERPLEGQWQWQKVSWPELMTTVMPRFRTQLGDSWLTDPPVRDRPSDADSEDSDEESDEDAHPPQR